MKCWYYTKRQREKMSTEAKKLKEFMDLSLLTSPKEALEIMKNENESEEENK